MKYSFFLSLFLLSSSWGLSLDDINDKPSSRQKNFLIWQFMNQDINASQASEAFYQVDNVNQRFLFDYAAKTDEAEIKYTVNCIKEPACNLPLIPEDDCLMLALTPSKAAALKNEERETIATRLNNKFGNIQWLRAMNQDSFYTSTQNLANETTLFRLAGTVYRYEHFNHPITTDILNTLTSQESFESIVFLTVTDPKMDQLQESLSDLTGGRFGPPWPVTLRGKA